MTNEVEANNHKDLKEKEKKHDSGAADLEKVTDYAEEKEIGSSSAAEDAIAVISKGFCAKIQIFILILKWFFSDNKQVEEAAKRMAREKELAKVSIKKEDVELIVKEMEISKDKAERTLREHAGNIVEALASLTNWIKYLKVRSCNFLVKSKWETPKK